MFFKSLQLYRLPIPWKMDLAKLEEQLQRGIFSRCPGHQPMSKGWVSPRQDGTLVYSLNNQWLLALTTEQRLLPASVINDEVKERAAALTETQGYAPGRRQLKELKERVTDELMPRAFTRRRTTFAWIDPKNGWLVIDAPSPAKADEVIKHLFISIDETFKPSMLYTKCSPMSAMADWLAGGEAPAGFTVDRDCELKAVSEEKSAIRYVRHPLDGEEIEGQIKSNLASGKMPTRLALTWDNRISFVLTDKLEIKRLAFLDLLKEEAEKNAHNENERFDADFALMTGELSRFFPCLIDALGGEIE